MTSFFEQLITNMIKPLTTLTHKQRWLISMCRHVWSLTGT